MVSLRCQHAGLLAHLLTTTEVTVGAQGCLLAVRVSTSKAEIPRFHSHKNILQSARKKKNKTKNQTPNQLERDLISADQPVIQKFSF